MVLARGWSDAEFGCLVALWNRESGWRVNAYNAGSGAYGIPQALPGSKMASAGADWETNAATQISWGLGYIGGRYGTPCGAWAHSEARRLVLVPCRGRTAGVPTLRAATRSSGCSRAGSAPRCAAASSGPCSPSRAPRR